MKKEIVWESYEDAKKRIEAEKKKKEAKKTTPKKSDTKKK